MNGRTSLSVGITQDFENCAIRKKFMIWLELQPDSEGPYALDTIRHIQAIEGLVSVERFATLSQMANEMREHLAEIRPDKTIDFNRGYQLAINLVIDRLEKIDINSQAATSIAELQAAILDDLAPKMKDQDDFELLSNSSKSLIEGEY